MLRGGLLWVYLDLYQKSHHVQMLHNTVVGGVQSRFLQRTCEEESLR